MATPAILRRNQTATRDGIMKRDDLSNELNVLGMLDKAREIYAELGEAPAISYVRSNYRLLSKIYHPDLNPNNKEKAEKMQQKINEIAHVINALPDKELIEIIKNGSARKSKDKWKVLVVEDEFGYQDTLRNIFTMEGFDVRVAIDGDTGYEVYRDFKPDIILTDVLMPNVSGIDLVRRIRRDDSSIKVIYMSGFFGVKRLKKEMDDEVNQYHYPTLSKPFKVSHLLDIVKEYLGLS
jgi:CheY-like chemotaxis protein